MRKGMCDVTNCMMYERKIEMRGERLAKILNRRCQVAYYTDLEGSNLVTLTLRKRSLAKGKKHRYITCNSWQRRIVV